MGKIYRNNGDPSRVVMRFLKWLRDTPHTHTEAGDHGNIKFCGMGQSRLCNKRVWQASFPYLDISNRANRMYYPNRKGLKLLRENGYPKYKKQLSFGFPTANQIKSQEK